MKKCRFCSCEEVINHNYVPVCTRHFKEYKQLERKYKVLCEVSESAQRRTKK